MFLITPIRDIVFGIDFAAHQVITRRMEGCTPPSTLSASPAKSDKSDSSDPPKRGTRDSMINRVWSAAERAAENPHSREPRSGEFGS